MIETIGYSISKTSFYVRVIKTKSQKEVGPLFYYFCRYVKFNNVQV